MKHIITVTFVVEDQENTPIDIARQFSLGYMTVTSKADYECRTYEPQAVVITSVDKDLDNRTMVDGMTF